MRKCCESSSSKWNNQTLNKRLCSIVVLYGATRKLLHSLSSLLTSLYYKQTLPDKHFGYLFHMEWFDNEFWKSNEVTIEHFQSLVKCYTIPFSWHLLTVTLKHPDDWSIEK